VFEPSTKSANPPFLVADGQIILRWKMVPLIISIWRNGTFLSVVYIRQSDNIDYVEIEDRARFGRSHFEDRDTRDRPIATPEAGSCDSETEISQRLECPSLDSAGHHLFFRGRPRTSRKWLKSAVSCAITVRSNPGGYGTNREQWGYIRGYRSSVLCKDDTLMSTLCHHGRKRQITRKRL
jgi:hypothetical protein